MQRDMLGFRSLPLAPCLLVLAACREPAPPAQAPVQTPAQAAAPTVRSYLLLTDGSYHDDGAPPPLGLYVPGTRSDDAFVPEGDILGEAELEPRGEPGWMELTDGSFHPQVAARQPVPPYVAGFRSEEGIFYPSTRTITR
jgi:hypothetical protein